YSAADLEALIGEARLLARRDGQQDISLPQAREALDNVRPSTLTSVEVYTRSAIDACTNLRYLPPAIAEAERARLAALRRPSEASAQLPPTSARHARQL